MAQIAFDLVSGTSQNLVSFNVTPDTSATNGAFAGSSFDVFGITDRSVNFDFADDSAGSFPPDNFGILGTGDTAPFFGVEDLDNSANPGGGGTAGWTFDIAGATLDSVSVDFAAMGDFEAGDNSHAFTVSIDGGPSSVLFDIDADNDDVLTYTLESGTTNTLNDPLKIDTDGDGTLDGTITNDFQTFTSNAVAGQSGSELTLTYVAGPNNGGSEPFAFRNIVVNGEAATSPSAVLINEFRPNPEGTDPERTLVELKGTPGASFSGVLLGLENDGPNGLVNNSGVDDDIEPVSGTFDANGLLTVEIGDLENPSFTLVLVDNFDGDASTDFDLDNDGTVDLVLASKGINTVFDAIGVADSAPDEAALYADQFGGTNIAFTGDEPKLVFRDGTNDTVYAVNDPDGGNVFDAAGNVLDPEAFDTDPLAGDTFGAINPSLGDLPPPPPPGPSTRLISEIQGPPVTQGSNGGADDASPLLGSQVTIEAVVVGDFQDGDADTGRSLEGFYLQEEDGDADGNALTSEGIFVFEDGDFITDVNVGDLVRVTGTVDEFFGETQIDQVSAITVVSSGNALPTPATIDLPASSFTLSQGGDVQPDLEAFEGMLVSFADTLTINEMFQLDRFNEIKLVQGDRPEQFTQSNTPDAAGFAAHLQEVGARQITYDDGLNVQNAPIGNLDGFGPVFTDANAPSMGDTIANLTGVLDYKWAGNSASQATWRVRSTEDGENSFANTLPRPAQPDDVGGDLTVATINVLNYFTTLDDGSALTANGLDPRGADDLTRFDGAPPAGTDPTAEFDRQTEKLITALIDIDASVLGLVELENNFLPGAPGNAVEALVDSLNAALSSEVYDWVDPGAQFVGTDAISTAIIYKPADVTLIASDFLVFEEASAATTFALADALNPFASSDDQVGDFQRNRPAVAATFEDGDGEQITVAVNHFKSKGDSNLEDVVLDARDAGAPQGDIDALLADPNYDQGTGAAFWNQVRVDAAIELADWLADTSSDGYAGGSVSDRDFLILGDLNAYAQEAPVVTLEGLGYTDLAETFEPGGFSFVFDGQVGTLDYAMASPELLGQITGATEWNINSNEADAVDYNLDFGRDPNIFDGTNPFRSSDHDPIIVGLDPATEPDVFTLEVLHLADQEAAIDALEDAPRASAVFNALEGEDLGNDGIADNTIRLSSGDAIIPGIFFEASSAAFGGAGRADILIQNALRFEAITLGNHEFDLGAAFLADLIQPDASDGYAGALFPYLAANLDFSTDTDLAPLAVEGGNAPLPNTVTSSIVSEVNGEPIGIIGAVTPNLASISSPGNVDILPFAFGSEFDDAELAALADLINAEVDALEAQGIDKIVLQSHFQALANEKNLIPFLSGVDIVIGGGSNTILADDTDPLRSFDSAEDTYPLIFDDTDGNPVALVNTDGQYRYVGRLVVDFDENGVIDPDSIDPVVSGAYKTDDEGVALLNAGDLVDPEVQRIVDQLAPEVAALQAEVVGFTDVFLNGTRGSVRTEETNLGNLTADANLAEAKMSDPTVVVSLKNGGGIRNPVDGAVPGTPPENGEVTVADHLEVLQFNNALTLVTLTGAQLVEVLEHAVSLTGADPTDPPGRFPQLAGVQFSFDPDLAPGSRIVNAEIVDENQEPLFALARDGEVVAPDTPIRVVTLSFLVDGGDDYPYPQFAEDSPDFFDREDLLDVTVRTGEARFASNGSEQDALAEYLIANFGTPETAYAEADTTREFDERIQNLAFRDDDVFEFTMPSVNEVELINRGNQRVQLTDEIDEILAEELLSDGVKQRIAVQSFEEGDMPGFEETDILSVRETAFRLVVVIDNEERDRFVFFGVDDVETLFPNDTPMV